MYSDRELLELAARAAGYVVEPDAHIPSGGIWLSESDGDMPWNPLTDDGDALRLAVKLGLQVTTGTYGKHESCAYSPKSGEHTVYVCYDVDMLSATRRAIVRAAAAIGEAMK